MTNPIHAGHCRLPAIIEPAIRIMPVCESRWLIWLIPPFRAETRHGRIGVPTIQKKVKHAAHAARAPAFLKAQ